MSHCQGQGSTACAQRCELLKTEQREKQLKTGKTSQIGCGAASNKMNKNCVLEETKNMLKSQVRRTPGCEKKCHQFCGIVCRLHLFNFLHGQTPTTKGQAKIALQRPSLFAETEGFTA